MTQSVNGGGRWYNLDQARDFLGSAPHAKSPGWRPGLFFGTQKR
jgi:hypothetical protein